MKHINTITGFVSLPQYQQCNISIAFSNGAGSSEPFVLPLGELCMFTLHTMNCYLIDTYPLNPNITNLTTTTTPPPTITITTIQSSSTVTTVSANLNVNVG